MRIREDEARVLLRTARVSLTKQLSEVKVRLKALQDEAEEIESRLNDIRHAEGILGEHMGPPSVTGPWTPDTVLPDEPGHIG